MCTDSLQARKKDLAIQLSYHDFRNVHKRFRESSKTSWFEQLVQFLTPVQFQLVTLLSTGYWELNPKKPKPATLAEFAGL